MPQRRVIDTYDIAMIPSISERPRSPRPVCSMALCVVPMMEEVRYPSILQTFGGRIDLRLRRYPPARMRDIRLISRDTPESKTSLQ